MMSKVAGILSQRYPECRAALKVFNRPRPKIALYGYNLLTTSKVIYSMREFYEVPNRIGKVITPTGLILFPLKP
jgi:hypothetical protein